MQRALIHDWSQGTGGYSFAVIFMLELRSISCLALAMAVTHGNIGNKVSLKSEHHHAKRTYVLTSRLRILLHHNHDLQTQNVPDRQQVW